MIEEYLWLLGSIIFIILGSIHLAYTFFTNKFSSKNGQLMKEMKASYPILTKETTMWKAWIGFNASHSIGMLFIGLINFYIAIRYYDTLHADHFFYVMNIIVVAFFVWLGKNYWFKLPFIGVLTTLICYLIAYCITFTR